MNKDLNDKFHDSAANVAESYEHRVRRLKIRQLIERDVILVAAAAAMVYIVKKGQRNFKSLEETLEK